LLLWSWSAQRDWLLVHDVANLQLGSVELVVLGRRLGDDGAATISACVTTKSAALDTVPRKTAG